jgi:hypothetical protein
MLVERFYPDLLEPLLDLVCKPQRDRRQLRGSRLPDGFVDQSLVGATGVE